MSFDDQSYSTLSLAMTLAAYLAMITWAVIKHHREQRNKHTKP